MRMRVFWSSFVLLFAIGHGSIHAGNWPRFRGVNGSGVASGAAAPAVLDGSHQLWEVEIPGAGHGSPVVFGEKLFLLTSVPVTDSPTGPGGPKGKGKKNKGHSFEWVALCLNRETGEMVWEKHFASRSFKGHRFNSAASSTPAVDEDQVVFAWGTPDSLTVVSLYHDGEIHWERDLGTVTGGHGFGGSPILYDGLVVLNNDQENQKGNLIALDANTGFTKWIVPRHSKRISYSVPCVYEADGKEVLVFVNWTHGFTAVDPADGSVVAEQSVFNLEKNERAISSPIVSKGIVIGTCGFTNYPRHCVAMKLEGGVWQEVWRVEKNLPHIPSVIAVGDYTFLIEDSGIGTCVETESGKELWKKRIPGVEGEVFGSPVSDGVNLFFADVSGNVHVIAASDEFQPVAMNRLGELCRTTPAIVDGTIYVRTETKLRAFR